jgi:hypothetical protein
VGLIRRIRDEAAEEKIVLVSRFVRLFDIINERLESGCSMTPAIPNPTIDGIRDALRINWKPLACRQGLKESIG